jgi:hypothetical protein
VESVGTRVAPVKLCESGGEMDADGDSLAEILERVIQAQGRLLRVERAPLAGPAGARASSLLRLTFDIGVVTVRPGGDASGLEVQIGEAASPGSPVFVSADEDDPWWRVMGCPLTRVQAREPGGVRVQFRGDLENPRRLVLIPRHGGIETSLEN